MTDEFKNYVIAQAIKCFVWQSKENVSKVERDTVTETVSVYFNDGDIFRYWRIV